MNITPSHSSTLATRVANPLAIGRIERVFGHLAALVQTRGDRRAAPNPERQPRAKPTRDELFRQVQREKWLGKRPTGAAAPAAVARPKDLHRRVLIDPNA